MASSSTPSIQKSFKYDVFLSFRGEDTRSNFVGHLYQALKQKAIETYKDDEKIKKGKTIDDQLTKSIVDSRFYIIVFSKNYASSSWCLDELVKIMECQKTPEQTAYPVFFDVEPTEVRKQSGAVKEAFAQHEKKEAAGKWREAMREASNLAGWELKATTNGDESKLIQIIVENIFRKLCSISLSIDGNLVGIEMRKKEVLSSLDIGTKDVRIIGIKGIGGGGKTTLARAVYNQISNHFEGKSFVDNVREVSKVSLSGLKKLQKQILSDVFDDRKISISSVSDGKKKMIEIMCRKKVLVVLDDVDRYYQLEALVGDLDYFKSGSRIIITTRDEQVLISYGVSLICNVNLLTDDEAVCLFSRYAYGKKIPTQGYNDMSGQVVRYAAGLPLTIKILGSFLRGKNELEWKDALERLKKIPHQDTLKMLEISYDALEPDHKDIFLDIACILKGEQKDKAIRVLESCGFHASIGLSILEKKSLISISKYGSLGMHDRIEEMGKYIDCHLHPDEHNRHSRLWIEKEIEEILDNNRINEAIRCIKLSPQRLDLRTFMTGLRNMKKVRVLYMCSGSSWDDSRVSQLFPNSLQYLCWRAYPFSSLHETFQADNLVGLDMSFSSKLQLWLVGNGKALTKLRFLDLSHTSLRRLNLQVTPNLERLDLTDCGNLEEINAPVKCLKNLLYLDITGTPISHLPQCILRLNGLRIIGSKMMLESFGFSSEIQSSDNKMFVNINGGPKKESPVPSMASTSSTSSIRKLYSTNSIVDGNLVGMEMRISDVLSSLEIGTQDVRMIGIKGMGGCGKTTLARAVYDQISNHFEGKIFIKSVRKVSKSSGLEILQKKILEDVLDKQDITFSSVRKGRDMLIATMRRRKILVVLDDVDRIEQLEALAGEPDWFKSGSRILITTRDERVLLAHRVNFVHDANLLSSTEAICLFSRYAFGRENPLQGYEELSEKVVCYAAGLPLTVKVLGSFLCGKNKLEWVDAIDFFKGYIRGLADCYKEIFVHIACMLKGKHKADATRILESCAFRKKKGILESCGFHARNGLEVLELRSLITIISSKYDELFLGMHDRIEEMGKFIVRGLHPDEPNKHSRFWINKEIEDILANDMGTLETKCLYLRLSGLSAAIENMMDLRFPYIETTDRHVNWEFDKVSEYLPISLRYMKWINFPLSSLTNTFQGKYLVELQIYKSNIVQLWEDGEEKVLNNLRFLTIGWSKLRTFDLRLAPNLEQLTIQYCRDFVELRIPADHHSMLEYFDHSGSKLTNLHLGNTPNLKTLVLDDCRIGRISNAC